MRRHTQAALPCHAALTCLDVAKSEGIRGTAPAKSSGAENRHVSPPLPTAGSGGAFSGTWEGAGEKRIKDVVAHHQQ